MTLLCLRSRECRIPFSFNSSPEGPNILGWFPFKLCNSSLFTILLGIQVISEPVSIKNSTVLFNLNTNMDVVQSLLFI